ncbi:MAG: hypothetical protein A2Z01_07265 [Betaproteobacteria bacterium RBG_16_58_11]|nr:MAG: hypothetical protein A2Z01_07265 [Betaproteobacteria bacterium RBG_16_58_11]
MKVNESKPDIDRIFEDGRLIDQALVESVKQALLVHKRADNPVAEWRDGKVVLIQPEDIAV